MMKAGISAIMEQAREQPCDEALFGRTRFPGRWPWSLKWMAR